MDLLILVKTLALAATAGGIAAASGYLKGKTIESFDGVVFIRTILLGIFLAAVLQTETVFHIDLSDVTGGFLFVCITAFTERIAVLAWRRLLMPAINGIRKITA